MSLSSISASYEEKNRPNVQVQEICIFKYPRMVGAQSSQKKRSGKPNDIDQAAASDMEKELKDMQSSSFRIC